MMKRKLIIFVILLSMIGLVLASNSLLFALEKDSKLPPCCQEGQNKKNTSSTKELEYYQKLILTKLIREKEKISIEGETDLPNGSKLKISVLYKTDSLEGVVFREKTIEVNNFRYSAAFPILDELKTKNIHIQILFDPKLQNIGISRKIPTSGVNLNGDQVELFQGRKILKTSQSIDSDITW